MKVGVLPAVLAMCLIGAGNCHAQAVTKPDLRQFSPAEQEVWAQEETYWRSLKADDRETYLRLWDERFIGWPRYEGAPAGKEKIRQEYAPGTTVRGKVLAYKLEPLSVRAYGNDVVITFFRATVTRGKPNGEVDTRTSRLTHTWMKTDQGWKIIGGMSAEGNQDANLIQSGPDRDSDLKAIFVSAKQLASEIHKVPEIGPSTFRVELIPYDVEKGGADVLRRTKPNRAEVHKRFVDMWYVIRGEGTLVTGGSLSQPTETETDEFRGPSITGGEERHIAAGDFVRIPAGVSHWIRQIDGDEIVYLVVKAPK